MNSIEKISQLRTYINQSILPLITSNYVLWGLPYYNNPGDTFIWEGALDLLKECSYKCIGTCGWEDYPTSPLQENIVILIMGGGFFGDVWRYGWDNVMNAITRYPNNPIVILPQSIYYENDDIANSDIKRLSKLEKLTICVRDEQSFVYAKTKFKNHIVLVPDLAFHCNLKKLNKFVQSESNKILYLKRNDKELSSNIVDICGENVEQTDWPIMLGHRSLSLKLANKLVSLSHKYLKGNIKIWFITNLYKYFVRNITIFDSIRFLSQYQRIYTTRLHVMILSALLGKDIVIMDNNYGKVSNCHKTWLSDCNNIQIMPN